MTRSEIVNSQLLTKNNPKHKTKTKEYGRRNITISQTTLHPQTLTTEWGYKDKLKRHSVKCNVITHRNVHAWSKFCSVTTVDILGYSLYFFLTPPQCKPL